MAVNLFGRDASFAASAARIASAFGTDQVWSLRPTREGNTVVIAGRGVVVPDRDTLSARADNIESRFGLPARIKFAVQCAAALLIVIPGGAVAEHVARGEAELGIHQISEILPVKGVTLVGPAWLRRVWLAVVIVVPATLWMEPITSNFAFGQINVVLMTLVIADCMPRRTPWPRGLLLGLGIALKLTPAVFLLYFVLRRDNRAALTAMGSFATATLLGFVLAWDDSWEYWTDTVHHTDRIGGAALNTDQNIAGALARAGLGEQPRFLLWVAGSVAVLALTVWAMRRVLRADEPTLAIICVALFGLVVSPVSWSHHWVWVLPAILVTAIVAWRRRNAALAAVCAVGVALMRWTPIDLLPKYHETTANWWRQLVGMSYVWWALALIIVAGATVTSRRTSRESEPQQLAPVTAVG